MHDEEEDDGMEGGNFVRAEVARKEGGMGGGGRGRKRTFDSSLVINLISTFLYMTNYYVVGPTSSKYMARLGGHEAWAGFLIGMTPLFALVSAVVYSTWTNKVFKEPLVFSAGMLLVGNLIYASALREGSIAMVLMGRAMTGLGGPRGINRRYIADTTTVEGRTKVSAAFVACGGLGMAVGPGMAVFLEVRPSEERSDELATPPQAAKPTRARIRTRHASSITNSIFLTHPPIPFRDSLRSL